MRASSLRRWAAIGLGLYLIAVLIVLLAPVSYAEIVRRITEWVLSLIGDAAFGAGWIEFTANVAMFVPLGFLLTILFRRHWVGVVVALLLSAGAEIAQAFIPSREASLRDIVANTVGAGVGAALAWIIVTRAERRASADGSEAPR